MRGIGKAFLALAVFAALGVSVLWYGLHRRHAARQEREATVARATDLCAISLLDFARKAPAERSSLLEQARRLKVAIQADPEAPPGPAVALRRWLAGRLELEEELARRDRHLTELLERLDYAFPADRRQQLAPEAARALGEAAEAARRAGGELTIEIEKQSVDLAPAFAASLGELTRRADAVTAELASREKAYQAFVEATRRKAADPAAGAARKAAAEVEKWIGYAVADPAKRAALEALYDSLMATPPARPQDTAALTVRLEGIVTALKKEAGDARQKAAVAQCDALLKTAAKHGVNKALMESADFERTRVQTELAARRKKAEAEAETQRLIGELIAKAGEYGQAADDASRQATRSKARELFATLRRLDPECGRFFEIALADVVTDPKPVQQPKEVVRLTGPDWGKLDAKTKYVDASRAALKAIADECRARGQHGERADLRPHYTDAARTIELYLEELDRVMKLSERQFEEARARGDGQAAGGPAPSSQPAQGRP